jgi:hypothetical protein
VNRSLGFPLLVRIQVELSSMIYFILTGYVSSIELMKKSLPSSALKVNDMGLFNRGKINLVYTASTQSMKSHICHNKTLATKSEFYFPSLN